MGENTYYLAFVDAIRNLKKANLPAAPLEKSLKDYVLDPEHAVPGTMEFPFKDLETVYGVDLSWFP